MPFKFYKSPFHAVQPAEEADQSMLEADKLIKLREQKEASLKALRVNLKIPLDIQPGEFLTTKHFVEKEDVI